jgi:hypothetical protein
MGSGINNTVRQLGAAAGVAVLGSLLASGYRSGVDAEIHHLGLAPQAVSASRRSIASALEMVHGVGATRGARLSSLARDAFSHGAFISMCFAAGFCLVVAAVIFHALRQHGRTPLEKHDAFRLEVEAQLAAPPELLT